MNAQITEKFLGGTKAIGSAKLSTSKFQLKIRRIQDHNKNVDAGSNYEHLRNCKFVMHHVIIASSFIKLDQKVPTVPKNLYKLDISLISTWSLRESGRVRFTIFQD